MNEFYASVEELEDNEELSDEQRLENAIEMYNEMLDNDGYADLMYKVVAERIDKFEGAKREALKESAKVFQGLEVDEEFLRKDYQSMIDIGMVPSRRAELFQNDPVKELSQSVIRDIESSALHYALAVLEDQAEYVSEIGSSGSFKFQEGLSGVLVMCCKWSQPMTAILFDDMAIASQAQIDVKKGRKEDMADLRTRDGYDWVL